MNREIKFRAWDKLNRLMIRSFAISSETGSVWNVILPPGETWEEKIITDDRSYELMQYTGLKDKNGKEIYEGDIVKNDGYFLIKWSLQVRWKVGLGWVFGEDWPCIPLYDVGNIQMIEVIGNIYENPELLSEK